MSSRASSKPATCYLDVRAASSEVGNHRYRSLQITVYASDTFIDDAGDLIPSTYGFATLTIRGQRASLAPDDFYGARVEHMEARTLEEARNGTALWKRIERELQRIGDEHGPLRNEEDLIRRLHTVLKADGIWWRGKRRLVGSVASEVMDEVREWQKAVTA